jgi:hypothetical protein
MRLITAAFLIISVCGGCTSTTLQRYTVNQTLSISDMRYQQVLNDLATIANNSGTLPSFALTAAGAANVTNTVSIDTATLWDQALKGFSKETLTAAGQHNPELQWTLDPIVSEPQLEALYYACLWALIGQPPEGSRAMELLREPRIHDINSFSYDGSQTPPEPRSSPLPEWKPPVRFPTTPPPSTGSPFSQPEQRPRNKDESESTRVRPSYESPPTELVRASLTGQSKRTSPISAAVKRTPSFHLDVARQLAAIPPGWLHVSPDHQVPKHVSFKATRGNTTVWVAPDGLAGLSEFTLVILDIATIDPTSLPIVYPQVTVNITEKVGTLPFKCPTTAGAGTPSIINSPEKDTSTGDKITEKWNAGQEIIIPDPSAADPAVVKKIGKIIFSRPKAFQHTTWATSCVEKGDGNSPRPQLGPLVAPK